MYPLRMTCDRASDGAFELRDRSSRSVPLNRENYTSNDRVGSVFGFCGGEDMCMRIFCLMHPAEGFICLGDDADPVRLATYVRSPPHGKPASVTCDRASDGAIGPSSPNERQVHTC